MITSAVQKAYEQRILAYLASEGKRIARSALESVEYKTDTGNLDDSFVWAVYNHGKLTDYGTAQPQSANKAKKWYGKWYYGHDLAEDFARSFIPDKKGYALVVAAVMPYGEPVEQTYGYRVIATAKERLQALPVGNKFSRTRIVHRGKAQEA